MTEQQSQSLEMNTELDFVESVDSQQVEVSEYKVQEDVPPNTENMSVNQDNQLVLKDDDDTPSHYNDDVYRDRRCDDDELRYQLIRRPNQRDLENVLEMPLYSFCDDNLETRYRQVINDNKVLPLETMRKSIALKLKKGKNKLRQEIKDVIRETFATYYPEKILTFITTSIELLFLERIKNMDREFTCVHMGTYYRMKMRNEYHKVYFGKSYNMVYLDIITSRFE